MRAPGASCGENTSAKTPRYSSTSSTGSTALIDGRGGSQALVRAAGLLHPERAWGSKAVSSWYKNAKGRVTQNWLARHPKFHLVFQPAYCPWVNVIERLWKQLHDTVTRNHRHATLNGLMSDIRRFLRAAEPFPGAGHGLASAR